jgi:5-formyltetrahydrofolate cyclo-ligase
MSAVTKADIRKSVLAKRNAASSEWRAMASADLARHALPHVSSGPGGPVAGYWPYKSEADVVFRRWIEGVELVDAGFGTLGPDASADIQRPAILLVPLAAFDSSGHRVGWGQGHYDRVIEKLLADGDPLLTVGIAFSFQQVEHVPSEAHDRPLDLIVTEQGVIHPAAAGG